MTDYAKVRLADVDDIPELMNLCRLLHAENAMFPMDDELVAELLFAFCSHQPTPHFAEPGMIGVIDGEKGLEGCISLRITQLWYSRKPLIEELFNFVHPDRRRSNHAKSLIRYAKSLADDLTVPLLIGIVSNTRTEQKIRLYERLLPFSGAFFVYRGDLTEEKAA